MALHIDGGLGAAEIDPETGVLRIRIAIDHIDVAEAAGLEGMLGGGVIRYLGAKGREILQEAIPAIEVPVTLSQAVSFDAKIGAMKGGEGGLGVDIDKKPKPAAKAPDA